MKKLILIGLILLLSVPLAHAQRRGPLTNVFASWVSVTTETTFNLPLRTSTERFTSRDVTIHNGSAVDICVDLTGGTIGADCLDDGTLSPSIFQLNGTASLIFTDFITTGITLKSAAGTASPVSVIMTY